MHVISMNAAKLALDRINYVSKRGSVYLLACLKIGEKSRSNFSLHSFQKKKGMRMYTSVITIGRSILAPLYVFFQCINFFCTTTNFTRNVSHFFYVQAIMCILGTVYTKKHTYYLLSKL
jgi:hypothetical protein